MHRHPLFTLAVGLIVGLTLGYVLAEGQPIPPARAAARQGGAQGAELPAGHPPVGSEAAQNPENQKLMQQAAELQTLLAQSPGDTGLMVALGNLYFDAGRWQEARLWYEQSLEKDGGDANVLTDLAVVYRNLQQPERALELLNKAIAVAPDHWQAWYNEVIVYHFDLHRHDEAQKALARLRSIAKNNPQVPDLSSLEAEVGNS